MLMEAVDKMGTKYFYDYSYSAYKRGSNEKNKELALRVVIYNELMYGKVSNRNIYGIICERIFRKSLKLSNVKVLGTRSL